MLCRIEYVRLVECLRDTYLPAKSQFIDYVPLYREIVHDLRIIGLVVGIECRIVQRVANLSGDL